jgi:hypothetical protein
MNTVLFEINQICNNHNLQIQRYFKMVENAAKNVPIPAIAVLDGNGPKWLFVMLAHELAHLVPFLAIFVRNDTNYICVISHSSKFSVGQIRRRFKFKYRFEIGDN